MKITNISIENFGRYKDSSVSFSDQDLIGISGENKETGNSIGTGKSTFLESILFALYGRYKGIDASNAVRKGEDGCSVGIMFELSNDIYLVYRQIELGKNDKSKTSLKVIKNDVLLNKGVTDGNQMIEQIIGMNYDLFTAVSFFVQDKADDLINATPAKKLEYFQTLCQLEVFEFARKKVMQDISVLSSDRQKKQAVLDHIKLEIESSVIEKDKDFYHERLSFLKNCLDNYIDLLNEYNENKENNRKIETIESQIKTKEIEINSIENEINTIKNSSINNIIDDDYNAASMYLHEINSEILSIDKELGEIQSLISASHDSERKIIELNNQIKSLENGSVCPACKRPFDNLGEVKSHILEIQKSISLEDEKIKSLNIKMLNDNISLLSGRKSVLENERIKHRSTLMQYDNNKSAIESNNKLIQTKQTKLAVLKTEKDKLTIEMSKYNKVELEDVDYQQNIYKTKDEINNIEQILTKIDEIKQKKKQISQFEKDIKSLSTEESDLQIIANSFSKNEIPKMIMQVMLDSVESDSNNILSELLENHSIRFETTQTSKSGKLSGTLQIMVDDGSHEREFSSFSGGERTLINFSLRLAISRYITKQTSKNIGVVVLDEVFASLDEKSLGSVMKALSVMSKDFYQIFNITHDPIIEEIFPYMLNVECSNGISDIKWG